MKRGKQSNNMHFKSVQISGMKIGPNDMAQINGYALSPLTPEDVFAFKVSMAGNDIDRDFEVFPRSTLVKLANLFVGKTVVKDHDARSDNQIARIYATELAETDPLRTTKTGEVFTELIAKCYMVKTIANADLIAEIQAGIRKEVSLGCRVDKAVCSVCGTDNVKTYCDHFPGKSYGADQLCYFSLENASDAYELSFVAVPAQAHAGTVKSYGDRPCCEEPGEGSEDIPAPLGFGPEEALRQLHEIARSLLAFQESHVEGKGSDQPEEGEEDAGRLTVNRIEDPSELEEALPSSPEAPLEEGLGKDEGHGSSDDAADTDPAVKDKTAQARLRALDLALSLRKRS